KIGSPVRIAGVSVGRVAGINLGANFSALVELRLRKGVSLPADTMASIKTNGLIGDKYLALSPGADERSIRPGEMLTETEGPVDIESLIRKFAFGSVKDRPDSK
ncbi:MAG TPA: MlaD family protein, partial [Opitutaceae bacterium]|nr:MlaD family protein [Opitutaceae bacterium]